MAKRTRRHASKSRLKPPSKRRKVIEVHFGAGDTLQEATDALADGIAARETQPGEPAFVICGRVGNTRIPAGFRASIMYCFSCGRPVWISTDTLEVYEKKKMVVMPFCGDHLQSGRPIND